jgi:hypothetical protein
LRFDGSAASFKGDDVTRSLIVCAGSTNILGILYYSVTDVGRINQDEVTDNLQNYVRQAEHFDVAARHDVLTSNNCFCNSEQVAVWYYVGTEIQAASARS